VLIHVTLGTGAEACTVWGCDLTAGYVHINADYTT
jgi:glutamate N-acetyltransferase / amino-acid N-acetyltransferase